MNITLDILDSPRDFKLKVMRACCDHINPRVFTKIKKLEEEVTNKIRSIIESSNEYKAILTNTQLIGDFGFPQGDALPYLQAIVNEICRNINITFSPFIVNGGRITGSIKIGAIISDFSDILSLPEAVIRYYSRRFQTVIPLDWLDWLLLQGNKIIIRDFHIEYENAGRSGEATMKIGGTWRVNPAISGTANNNILTRIVNAKSIVDRELVTAVENFFNRIV